MNLSLALSWVTSLSAVCANRPKLVEDKRSIISHALEIERLLLGGSQNETDFPSPRSQRHLLSIRHKRKALPSDEPPYATLISFDSYLSVVKQSASVWYRRLASTITVSQDWSLIIFLGLSYQNAVSLWSYHCESRQICCYHMNAKFRPWGRQQIFSSLIHHLLRRYRLLIDLVNSRSIPRLNLMIC